jgi:hypothetical protein
MYWNLLELYGAVHHGGLGALFSAACGCVRRGAFFESGMYDEWVFRGESVEDVELAMRLHTAGHRIHFSREVQVNHLRRYTARRVLGEVWRCSLLLLRSVGFEATRSGARGHVVHTLVANWAYVMVVLALAAVIGGLVLDVDGRLIAAVVLLLLLLANVSVHGFLVQRRGLLFTLGVAPLHWAAQVVCAAGSCAGIVMRNLIGDPAPDPTTQAFAEVGVTMWPPVPRRR